MKESPQTDAASLALQIGSLTSPVVAVKAAAIQFLLQHLVALEDFIGSGQFREFQLRELALLGGPVVPILVRLVAKFGPNDQNISGFLIQALKAIGSSNPAVLAPHQAEIRTAVLALSPTGYSFYGETSQALGLCYGLCGSGAESLIAEDLAQHAGELGEFNQYSKDAPLRLLALVHAAEICTGPLTLNALIELLKNAHGVGLAMRALRRIKNPAMMHVLGTELVNKCASGYQLQTLRELLLIDREEAEPLAQAGKDRLFLLAREAQHPDVQGTALGVLFRFFATEALPLARELAKSASPDLKMHLIRSAFAGDGLIQETHVSRGGYSIDSGNGTEVLVVAQTAYHGTGSVLTADHLAIVEAILASGPSDAASFLFGLLGTGCYLSQLDVLCVDLFTQTPSSNTVRYLPVSLLGTPADLLRSLGLVAAMFIKQHEAAWNVVDKRNSHCAGTDFRMGAIHAVRFLARTRQIGLLAELAKASALPKSQATVLLLCGALAGELAAEYQSALEAGNPYSVWGLIPVLRTTPEAVSLLRRYGVGAIYAETAKTCFRTGEQTAFQQIVRTCPGLAHELYTAVRTSRGVIDHAAGLDRLHGSGANPIETLQAFQNALTVAA